jgi:hypothetical protein
MSMGEKLFCQNVIAKQEMDQYQSVRNVTAKQEMDQYQSVRMYQQSKRWANTSLSECNSKARDRPITLCQNVTAKQEMDQYQSLRM